MLWVSYNIQYSKGKDDRFDLERIIEEIAGADLIALQEVETGTARTDYLDQAQAIAELLPDYHFVFGPGIDADASEWQNGKLLRRRQQFGNMVLSRWPIVSSANHLLPKQALCGAFHLQRSLLETVINLDGKHLRFCSLHLDHVAPQTRLPQVQAMLDLLHSASSRGATWGGPVDGDFFNLPAPPMPEAIAFLGDMNFDFQSEEYQRVVGPMSQHFGRLTPVNGLLDAWLASGNTVEAGVTIGKDVQGKRIDHCFISQQLGPALKRMWIDNEAQGSDHQPIWLEWDLANLKALLPK